jgi:hypothetical protein
VRLTRRSFHGRGVSRPSSALASGMVVSSCQRGMNPGQLGLGANARCVDHHAWGAHGPAASRMRPHRMGPGGSPACDQTPGAEARGTRRAGWLYHDATSTSVQGGVGAATRWASRGSPAHAGEHPGALTPSLASCAPCVWARALHHQRSGRPPAPHPPHQRPRPLQPRGRSTTWSRVLPCRGGAPAPSGSPRATRSPCRRGQATNARKRDRAPWPRAALHAAAHGSQRGPGPQGLPVRRRPGAVPAAGGARRAPPPGPDGAHGGRGGRAPRRFAPARAAPRGPCVDRGQGARRRATA